MSVEIDMTKFDESLAYLSKVAGKAMPAFLQDEAILLGKTIVNFVPPLRNKRKGYTPKVSGEMAIKTEMTSLFSEANQELIDLVGSKHGLHDINAWTETKGGEALNLQWAHINLSGAQMEHWHNVYQNRNGKVPIVRSNEQGIWRARVVVPRGMLAPFIKSLQRRVGRARASFAQGIARMGVDFPSWISRHFGQVNDISIFDTSRISDPVSPSITFGSRAPGIWEIRSNIKNAVALRSRAMMRRAAILIREMKKSSEAQTYISPAEAFIKRHTQEVVE